MENETAAYDSLSVIRIREAHSDGLVKEKEVCVAVPRMWVVLGPFGGVDVARTCRDWALL